MTETLQKRLESYFDRLWPINRNITGPGSRKSLDILGEIMPMQRYQFKTDSQVFDWTVPGEWDITAAYFIDPHGVKHADFQKNNLHIIQYSVPFAGKLTLDKLRPHLHSIPEQPDAIPYKTSYYQECWGFCLAHNELLSLPEGEYEVVIDAKHYPGHIEIGEAVLPGTSKQEILITSYLCHPSLANNELSGPLVLTFLYERIKTWPKRRYTYRFVLAPESIGSICYLSLRGQHLKKCLLAGYLLTCIGDPGDFTYRLSRRGDTVADQAARLLLRDYGTHSIIPFDPSNGSSERHFCSPGFNLPFGSLSRTLYGCYPEYHTSLDNKEFISFGAMADSVDLCFKILEALESNCRWFNKVQFGEPQLAKRGLYPSLTFRVELEEKLKAMMWLLNLADGEHDLFKIAERSGHQLQVLIPLAEELAATGLITEKI